MERYYENITEGSQRTLVVRISVKRRRAIKRTIKKAVE
jgi:hypothetical protein